MAVDVLKTTKKDFELFKSECKKWIDKLGITGWEIYYTWKDLNGFNAQCEIDWVQKTATLRLGES